MIKDMFLKDINRTIEGVVKADNLTKEAIYQEVDEYVVTKELHKILDSFFQEYSSSLGRETHSIGVWISGHFGSGKSHLLKILSYILSNQQEYGELIKNNFLNKIDADDFDLRANITKALNSSSQTILFNIDQKSDIGNKSQEDAILSVFMKVFNELRGYYPKFGYIAQFERDLDKKGKYQEFKEIFKEISGESWESGREAIFLEIENFAKALSRVNGISYDKALDVIQQYEKNYKLSIEEFANDVKEYIDTQDSKDFRLVFCVDEIGQYIGDNIKLMLNLQTIVETLATVCKGQAWVVVTSQSAVDEVIDANDRLQNDFSKIMGRFKVKLNLTSQNANEVIQKRLLLKTKEANEDLKTIYSKIKNQLSSLINFTDRTRQYRSYKYEDEFVLVYPFIPYQMDLFQSCIESLSKHNVFQGKHQSTGERSMLDVVQNITRELSKNTVGSIATFDMFYDGISGIIRGEIQTQINKSKEYLSDFDLKVLKTLFMIKYVKEFKADIDNITTLLIDNIIDIDLIRLKKDILNSLNKLISQTYIQKIGLEYEFLTDVEKDIEEEIKATTVEDKEIVDKLTDWLYGDIVRFSKIKYKENKQDYLFAKKLDDILVKGKDEELGINILSDFYPKTLSEDELIHKSFSSDDIIMPLQDSFEFKKELELYVKTQKYIPQKTNSSTTNHEKLLLSGKSDDNHKRREKLMEDLKASLEEAPIYLNGQKIEIKKDIKAKLEEVFEKLIEKTYTYITMLPKIYEEKDIDVAINTQDDLLSGSDDALDPADEEVFNYITRQKNTHQAVTLLTILENFKKRPYGWYQNAILTILAQLFTKQKIEFKQNSTILSKDEVLKSLKNNRQYATTIITPTAKVDNKKIKKIKDILEEFFAISFDETRSSEIIQKATEQTRVYIEKFDNFFNLEYPFKEDIKVVSSFLKDFANIESDDFFDEVIQQEDELLDIKDDYLDPILEFMQGNKRVIYDDAKRFLQTHQNNLRYIDSDTQERLKELLKDHNIYKSNNITILKKLHEELENLLKPIIEQEQQKAIKRYDELIKRVQNNKNFNKVEQDNRHLLIKPLLNFQDELKNIENIDTIRQLSSDDMLEEKYHKINDKMIELLPEDKIESIKEVSIKRVLPVQMQTIKDMDDIQNYLKELEENLKKYINDGYEILI